MRLIGFKISLLAVFINTAIIYAQNVSIEISQLSIIDKHLEINYDFIKAKKNHRFEVSVEINNSNGEKINARTVSGDLGPNITIENNKKIIWDYNADGLVINEDVEVFVVAKQSTVSGTVSGAGCVFKSLLMPGLGMSSIEKGKPYWILGLIGYGTLGTAIYLNSSSNSNYNKYLNTIDVTESNNYFNKSQSQKDLSKAFAIGAIGTWSFSIIWTIIKVNQHNNSIAKNLNLRKFDIYSCVDPIGKKPLIGFKYNF